MSVLREQPKMTLILLFCCCLQFKSLKMSSFVKQNILYLAKLSKQALNKLGCILFLIST